MLLSTIYLLSPVLLVLLLISRKKGAKRGTWFSKPALSAAFVLCAVLNAQSWGTFELLMLCGFLLCFAGDVFLIPDSRKMFTVGLVAFLAGHLFYLGAFASLASWEYALIVPAVLLTAIILLVMRWLRPFLQDMRGPVVSYIVVISCMVLTAWALALNTGLPLTFRILVLGGAVGFFVSDLFVVRQRFVCKTFKNPLIGLPLYYGGQFALAISLAYIE